MSVTRPFGGHDATTGDGPVMAADVRSTAAHALALSAALVLIGTFLSEFYRVTDALGGTAWLVAYVAVAFVAATLLAPWLPERAGLAAGAVLVGGGVLVYHLLLPDIYYVLLTADRILDDLVGWLTGRSVVLMLEADLWAVSVAPGPVFLTWYLALRRRYDVAALAGGGMLAFFVLTGDAGGTTTLVGSLAALGLLGFGSIAESDGTWQQLQELGLVMGLVVLLTQFVQVVPAAGTAGSGGRGGGSARRLEQALLARDGRLTVGGSVSLSEKPRFRVRAEEAAYWHVRSFDRYTGRGWRRTRSTGGADQPLSPPPGDSKTLKQEITAERSVDAMPAAWKPVLLDSTARDLSRIVSNGDLEPVRSIAAGDSYTVISQVPAWTESDLRAASAEYPASVRRRYLQIPEDTPARLAEKAAEIAADAEGPYETARAIQDWLKTNKEYSLSVRRRQWDVADAFVFVMEKGYCVYFATAMAVMLRTLDVPARFAVGYAPGERVDDDERLVRGFHSHAWVEVYFPDVGWVTFDPTPARGRAAARRQVRESGTGSGSGPGAGGSRPDPDPETTPTPEPTPEPTPSGTDGNASNGSAAPENQTPGFRALPGEENLPPGTPANEDSIPGAVQGNDSGPSTDTGVATRGSGGGRDRLWLLGALLTVGFGSVRLGLAGTAFREVWLRYQPRTGSPERDVRRALDRLEYLLAKQHRERRPEETWRQYLRALHDRDARSVDGRVRRVVELYLMSRYGEEVSRETADEAIDIVDDLVRGGR